MQVNSDRTVGEGIGMKGELSPAALEMRTTHVGVSALDEETGLSQGYISKLLARGWPEDEIRAIAERAGFKREIKEWRKAERERWEKRRR